MNRPLVKCCLCEQPIPDFNHEAAEKDFIETFGYKPKEHDWNACCHECWTKQALPEMRKLEANN